MSSEEETDSQGPYDDSLDRKQKRPRQRVDAGEPRNNYSSVPSFNATPGFMSGGIYGAIFNQGRQHFSPFGPPGYSPKMLNELLGRAPKQDSEEEPGTDIHVLRDMLRKKELMQLERELRGGTSPDNNNVLANNNNDEPKREKQIDEEMSRCDESDRRVAANDQDKREMEEALMNMNGASDSRSLPSPSSMEQLVTPKTEPDVDMEKDGPRSPSSLKGERVPEEIKRARVENIVSTMRSSPAPPTQPQVNGCKKRKLYHPQQHDGERYGLNSQSTFEEEEEESDRPVVPIQKLVEKSVLKTQLRTMQEQLAEIEQKYVQLRNQMSNQFENQDENSSDVEHIEEREKSSPAESPKEMQAAMQNSQANMLTQMMTKMMNAKIGHLPHPLPPGFNGSLSMMQQLAQNHEMHQGLRHPNPPHPNLSNAAAMYFGQKIFMEQQQARMKEAAQAAEHQNQQQQLKQENQRPASLQHSPNQRTPINANKASSISSELQERLEAIRTNTNSVGPVSGVDLEGLAEVLKSEMTASLTTLVDSIVSRFVSQRRYLGKQTEAAAAAAEQLNKDLMLASRILERKSPQSKQPERQLQLSGNPPVHSNIPPSSCSGGIPNGVHFMNHSGSVTPSGQINGPRPSANFSSHTVPEPPTNYLNQNTHVRPPPTALFQTPKPPQGMPSLYGAMNGSSPFCIESNQEQSEALSLVVTPNKKKRHKVTDTRITPRTVSRILSEGAGPSPIPEQQHKFPDSPSPTRYHPSLPTSVAIPNPSLHESQVFSPYSPFFNPHGGLNHERMLGNIERDSPPLPHPPALLHPALVAAAHHPSPEYLMRQVLDQQDAHSPCNSTDISYDGMQPTISFSIDAHNNVYRNQANSDHSSTLSPMHLRKAKLMFFWVRYPSSAVLKMYFPDIKFNKNNTAQLVKWFSNFREFYYIQMEKYARQAISEGAKSADELHVAGDSEIYRVLNLHYNRNNHIEVPTNFRYVVEQTLKEFFRAVQGGKDTEQSWKKSIYKIISRLDDPVPEYFKSPNFLEQLE